MQPQSTSATTSSQPPVDPAYAPLHERITAAMERLGVPGVAVGILHDGQQHTAGFGVTNVKHPAPVLPDTLFQIGSITKTLTATAVMRLVEAGTLDLDTPVRAYLPDLTLADESVAARVTLRHLLTHTAGWEGDSALTLNTGRGDDALARFIAVMRQAEQQTPLGAVWSYNNAGFYLAGRAIEAVTGKPYETALRELVLVPLGMTHAYFFPEEVMLHSFAVGHNVVGDVAEVARPWPIPRNANPAGGITTSAGDLLRYARFELGDGTAADGARILSRTTLDLMQTPAVPADEGRHVGLAWYIRDLGGVRLIGHGGGTIGQVSLFQFAPSRGFALTILTNANRGGELIEDVSAWALKRYLGIEEPARVPQARTEQQLAAYAGRYVAALTLAELAVHDGRLMLQLRDSEKVREFIENPAPPPPPTPIAFYADDKIVATDGPMKDRTAEFLRDPNGGIAWLRLGGRLFRRAG